MIKRLAVFSTMTGLLLLLFGSYMIYSDKHQFWESLYAGIVLIFVGLIIMSALKSRREKKESSKTLFKMIAFFMSLGLATLFLILYSTIEANKDQILIKGIQENTTINNEIGGFSYVVISYPSKGSGRRRNQKAIKSNVYLIKGKDRYVKIRTYEVREMGKKYLLDTIIRVHSLNPDEISFETSKAIEDRIFREND